MCLSLCVKDFFEPTFTGRESVIYHCESSRLAHQHFHHGVKTRFSRRQVSSVAAWSLQSSLRFNLPPQKRLYFLPPHHLPLVNRDIRYAPRSQAVDGFREHLATPLIPQFLDGVLICFLRLISPQGTAFPTLTRTHKRKHQRPSLRQPM